MPPVVLGEHGIYLATPVLTLVPLLINDKPSVVMQATQALLLNNVTTLALPQHGVAGITSVILVLHPLVYGMVVLWHGGRDALHMLELLHWLMELRLQ